MKLCKKFLKLEVEELYLSQDSTVTGNYKSLQFFLYRLEANLKCPQWNSDSVDLDSKTRRSQDDLHHHRLERSLFEYRQKFERMKIFDVCSACKKNLSPPHSGKAQEKSQLENSKNKNFLKNSQHFQFQTLLRSNLEVHNSKTKEVPVIPLEEKAKHNPRLPVYQDLGAKEVVRSKTSLFEGNSDYQDDVQDLQAQRKLSMDTFEEIIQKFEKKKEVAKDNKKSFLI